MILLHGVLVLVGLAVGVAVDRLYPLSWLSFLAIAAVVAVAVRAFAGSATRGRALRRVSGNLTNKHEQPQPPPDLPLSQAWYIESRVDGGGLPHSCSFIEFDERGDYLNFEQHRHAYETIKRLRELPAPLTVVIYVHGWRHNGQSNDVISFNEFLGQLSAGEDQQKPRRVHGVYIAWRGGCLRHDLTIDDVFDRVTRRYGSEIVDPKRAARIGWFNFVLESLSYFDRKSIPEHKFSGTSLSRTLFSCAYAAKRGQTDTEVFLIGHSLGGLMLERTFQNAAIGQLTEAWPWGVSRTETGPVNPLPFDTVVLVNSAAPSIYAKQFQSYLAAHRQAMIMDGVPNADTPIVFSVTTSADWATGKLHPAANGLARWLPTLRHNYFGGEFILEEISENDDVVIPQAYYYAHTPGHNPLLVNRFVEPVKPTDEAPTTRKSRARRQSWPSSVGANLKKQVQDPLRFETILPETNVTQSWWISFPPSSREFKQFSTYDGRRPLVWTNPAGHYPRKDTAYWIIRCPPAIMRSHGDIWSQPAMDMYAAFHRIGRYGLGRGAP